MITVPATGPRTARCLVLLDFPSLEDEKHQAPLSGPVGNEFKKMLQEAGFLTTELRFTFLCKFRPYASQMKYAWTTKKKEGLLIKDAIFLNGAYQTPAFLESLNLVAAELQDFKPNVIIACGDAPLWYLTGETSISKWRGSLLSYQSQSGRSVKVIPTFSPAQVIRFWEWRPVTVRDLQRAFLQQDFPEVRAPNYNLRIRPTFSQVKLLLTSLLFRATQGEILKLSCDIETISRHIACIGIAWNRLDALCIPFMIQDGHYFTLEEEVEIVSLLQEVLTHPNIKVIGQNWTYDTMHIIRSWGFRPQRSFDTMLAQHVLFPGIQKDLAFLASMYCEHYVYWKDELTDYRSLPSDLDKFWFYNAKDCINTYEIAEVLDGLITRLNFRKQFDFLLHLAYHVDTMMLRGVKINRKIKDALALELYQELAKRKDEINYLIGGELNISSPTQLKRLFYDEMQFKPIMNRKTHQPSADDDALEVLSQREPLLRPFLALIRETKSIGVFLSTFVMMPLDTDGRMRTSFNVGGTETFRFSSSKNAFGSGGNLQNIPKGNEEEEREEGTFTFPNLRRMFIPDTGKLLFDVDLSGADAQVVAWEADDADLKAKFRSGEKIHALNAKDIYGADAGPDGKRAPYYAKAKMGCHLTNYGGKLATLSKGLGMTMREAEHFQRRWFSMHPGIKEWHERVENQLYTTRSVSNKFGFRRFYFDRIEGLLPQALAWIPQSTVALIINHGLCNIADSKTSLELLLQVHDSLVGQFPIPNRPFILPILRKCLAIPVPYTDPLTISTSLDLSEKSWGDLISCKWDDK